MNKTKIDWCSASLNPVVGCTYGCPFCYARKLNTRFGGIEDFSKPQFFPDRLKSLYSKKPQTIFMDSMSDIADWKLGWLLQVYHAINVNPQHKYLFLTKRPESGNFISGNVLSNVWNGVSITKENEIGRLNYLPTLSNRFVSLEPILEDLKLSENHNNIFKRIQWFIIGAETGNRKEKVIPRREWVQDIVDQCKAANVPVFLKSSLTDIWGEPLIQEFPW